MYPILYDSKSTEWSTLGIGPLSDAISCYVTEERNGVYELKMEYPINGLHYESLKEGALIKAKANDTSVLQIFRTYRAEKSFDNRINIEAEHISYALNNYPFLGTNFLETSFVNKAPTNAVSYVFSKSPIGVYVASPLSLDGFTFWSDITSQKTFDFPDPCSIRSFLGGKENSLLNLWQGEFEFDNKAIKYYQNRGRDNGVIIKFGKNMTDLMQEISIEGLYTHVFPYARKTIFPNQGDPYDVYIFASSTNANRVIPIMDGNQPLYLKYGFVRTKYLDLSDKFDPDDEISESDVLSAANSYISANTGIQKPKITLTVSFQPLKQKDDNGLIANLEKVSLCDSVTVVHPRLGINEKLKVNKTVYNVLTEKYKSIEIGDPKSNFSDTVFDQFEL